MRIKNTGKLFGEPVAGSLECFLSTKPENIPPVAPVVQPSRPITPATGIVNPQEYIILEGRTHGNYTYGDTLVAMDKTHHGKNWFQSHEALSQEGAYMLGIRQFVDFLNLLKNGNVHDGKGNRVDNRKVQGMYDEICKVGGSWRSEWLDADFKVLDKKFGIFGGKVAMNYEHRIVNGKLTPHRTNEVLEGYLDQNKKPGIDFNQWRSNATYQGLPTSNISDGDLWYWRPCNDDNSVAGFDAYSDGVGLGCNWSPQVTSSALGVRAARAKN